MTKPKRSEEGGREADIRTERRRRRREEASLLVLSQPDASIAADILTQEVIPNIIGDADMEATTESHVEARQQLRSYVGQNVCSPCISGISANFHKKMVNS